MGRDYRPVVQTSHGFAFFDEHPSWSVNVWAADFYGRVFHRLRLPVFSGFGPGSLKHVYRGSDFVKTAVGLRHALKSGTLPQAIREAAAAMPDPSEEPLDTFVPGVIDEITTLVIPMFDPSRFVAVMSDMCDPDDVFCSP